MGAGLSGLTAAIDLAKKGYEVVILEGSDRLGGRVWDCPETQLPREDMKSDFQVLQGLYSNRI